MSHCRRPQGPGLAGPPAVSTSANEAVFPAPARVVCCSVINIATTKVELAEELRVFEMSSCFQVPEFQSATGRTFTFYRQVWTRSKSPSKLGMRIAVRLGVQCRGALSIRTIREQLSGMRPHAFLNPSHMRNHARVRVCRVSRLYRF
eukprot:1175868-Prorocentrum_minimum.AAC.3